MSAEPWRLDVKSTDRPSGAKDGFMSSADPPRRSRSPLPSASATYIAEFSGPKLA